MPAVEEAPAPVKKPAYSPSDEVMVFCVVSPCITLSVEKVRSSGHQDHTGRPIKIGRSRMVEFKNHRCMIQMRDMNDKWIEVDDGMGGKERQTLQIGVRNMEGYGRDFFEAVRTPGMDTKADSLMEIQKKNPKQFASLMKRAQEKNTYANGEDGDVLSYNLVAECLQFEAKWKAAHPEK